MWSDPSNGNVRRLEICDPMRHADDLEQQMSEHDILDQVRKLVDVEHQLRSKRQAGEIDSAQEHDALKSVEEALDQCWDLLRQRRARSEFGENPDEATARPVKTVESYLQ